MADQQGSTNVPAVPSVERAQDARGTASSVDAAIALQQAAERLRQEQETFDQRKAQDAQWFKVRLALWWTSIILIPAIAVFCAVVILATDLDEDLKKLAAGALLVDVLGLAGIVWRGVAGLGPPTDLEPTTDRPELPPTRTPLP